MTTLAFDSAIDDVARGNIDFETDTFYALLTSSAYTPNKGTHTKRSDVTNEISGTGYTAGGQAIAATVTKDTVNHRVDVAFATISWPNVTATGIRQMVIYKRRGGAASADELVAVIDNGSDVSPTAQTVQFTPGNPLRFAN